MSPHPDAVDAHSALVATPVRALLRRTPVTLTSNASVRDAARLMSAQRVSSVLLVDDGRLRGIVTDRDLRSRVLAAGLASDRPLHEVATADPMRVDLRATAFEAMLLMARNNIHHVPVTDGERLVGMITATDLAEQHSGSALFLAGEIHKCGDVEALRRSAQRIRALQRNLAAASATAHATGHVITAITDALTRRLLQLAEAQLGAAPIGYAWAAAGSQARCEQTAKSDQDNCLLLDDAYDAAVHGAYFDALSRFVCDGLDACGYIHCPGEMMAMTATWRQPLRQWRRYFEKWVDTPEPQALMLTGVFFDLRAVHGQAVLLDQLRAEVLQRTRGNGIFLAHMAGNALSREPPLGLFGRISTERSGEHRGTVDLKYHGIVPIVDLARVYALAAGHAAVNTSDRLEAACDSGEVSAQSARDLRDALEHLAAARIRHQALQIEAERPADNFLSLEELSNFERTQLKHAFTVVRQLQQLLGARYRGALL